jgi:hypothetical protein
VADATRVAPLAGACEKECDNARGKRRATLKSLAIDRSTAPPSERSFGAENAA